MSIHGVVPCAGLSARMGRSKALLDAAGRPFLARVVDALRQGGCAHVTVVVRDPNGPEARLAGSSGAEVLENADPSDGPISSVRAVLDAAGAAKDGPAAEGIAVLPVDHPLVRGETVRVLLAAARDASASGEASIILPRHGARRGHPAVFLAPVWPELLDPALEGGARTVVRRDPGRVLEVEVDDPGVLKDIDDPDSYRRYFPHGADHGA